MARVASMLMAMGLLVFVLLTSCVFTSECAVVCDVDGTKQSENRLQ